MGRLSASQSIRLPCFISKTKEQILMKFGIESYTTTQPPIQWVPGVLSPGVKSGRGMTLTTRPHLVPRLRMSRSYISSPPMCLHGV
jgi:hypothetical protein